MNCCSHVGRFTRDLELRYMPNGETAVLNFTLAVDRKYKKEDQPTADFLNFVVFGKPAELIEKYCAKGHQIAVNSRSQSRTWQDTEGAKHFTTEFVVESFTFLNNNKSNGSNKETSSETEDFQL